jgi:hypothetical protein
MSPMFGMQGSQIALILGIGLFVFVLLKRVRRGFGEATHYRSKTTGGAALHSVKVSKHQEPWEVEMHALARQLKGEIDTKARALERLIQMADEARHGLDSSIRRAESLGLLDEHDHASTSVEKTRSDQYSSALVGSAVSSRTSSSSSRGSVASGRLRVGEGLADDPRFERVYALADAGFSAARIASQVGSQVGEVELILSLRATNESL